MIEIINRFNGEVQVRAEVTAPDDMPRGIKLGRAAKWAIRNNASLVGAKLRYAYLVGVNWPGVNLIDIDLFGATLTRAYLAGVNLSGANLTKARLDSANFNDANLIGADLTASDLTSSTLIGANLTGVNLTDSNLTNTDLTDADLTKANLIGADLTTAKLIGAKGVIDAGTPNGKRTIGWLQKGYLAIRIGRHNMRLARARKYWQDDHPEVGRCREIRAALDYIEAVARQRGWAVCGWAA